MSIHRLIVGSEKGQLAQGTAWAVAPGIVCSAFHVCGHGGERRWMHELVDGVSYCLEGGAGSQGLEPLVFDADADLALLTCKGDAGPELPLAQFSRKNVRWEARGYPGFHDGREFTVSGLVVDLRDGEHARAVQLALEQGAEADWGGISGAAVVEQLRVIAVITNITDGTATGWAAPVEAVRRLLNLADLAAQVAAALGHDGPPGEARRGYEGVDRRRLRDILEPLARPDDPGLAALLTALERNLPAQARPSLSIDQIVMLRDEYGVVSVRQGGGLIRSIATREFAELLGETSRFGGRHDELAKFDRWVSESQSGYFFVTGISGFGKTSLLARWIGILRQRGDTTCFHFFTASVPDSLNAGHAFGRLAEQLLAAHGLGGEPPRDPARLQALYVDLLKLPAPGGRPLAVVLDGLDEALVTLRPSRAMFPQALGEGVHVLFSARTTADKDWLRDLDLQLGDEAHIELGRLGRADIAEILERAGLPPDPLLTGRLEQKTSGDPFYVADVVRALAEAGGRVDVLDSLPATHSEYLLDWWKNAVRGVAQPGFIDLMGTLAALRAPLAARELTAISKEDKLDNAHIGVLLEDAARYVEDDRQGRYWLRHDRIRQFVRDTLGDDMRDYDARVREFALRWNDPTARPEARAYGLRHVIAHLLAEDRFEPALALVDAEFIAARWREDGSYSALLVDLDAMLDWTRERPSELIPMCHALALAVMRESARDLMRGLPAPLCRAWVRLEGQARPLEMLASLPSHRGEAREQLLAVAGVILDLPDVGDEGRAVASELLARTIGLLPLVRSSLWVLEAVAEVCRLLAAHAFDPRQVDALLKQGMAYASHLDVHQQDLKAACLAHLAVAASSCNRPLTARLIDEVEALALKLPLGDRAAVLAIAFPAYRELAADRIGALALEVVEELAWYPLQSSNLSHAPLHDLLSAWAPDPAAGGAVRALIEAREHGRPWLKGRVHYPTDPRDLPLPLLCKLGLEDMAWGKLERELASDTPDILLLLAAYEHMPARRAPLLAAMSALFIGNPNKPGLAQALALAGRWSDVRGVLGNLKEKDLGWELSRCLTATLAQAESSERERTLDAIIGQLERLPDDNAAEWAGVTAEALARARHAKSREVLGVAFRAALSQLPEGDADDTRRLVAVGLASEGRVDEAMEVALASDWWHMRIRTLLAVLCTLPPDAEGRAHAADHIGDLVKTGDETTFLDDALIAACAAVRELGAAHASAAARLLQSVELAHSKADFPGSLMVLGEIVLARAVVDPKQASESSVPVAAYVRELASGGMGEVSTTQFRHPFSLCASLIETGSARQDLLDAVLDWGRALPLELKERVVFAAAAGAAAARVDTSRATQLFFDGIDDLAKLKGVSAPRPPSALLARLFSDLTGGANRLPPWAEAARDLASALVTTGGRFEDDTLSDLLGRLYARALEVADNDFQLQSAALAILAPLSALPPSRQAVLKLALSRVLAALEQRQGDPEIDRLLSKLSFDFGARGHAALAHQLVQRITDVENRDMAVGQLELFAYFHALQDRSPVEQTLFELTEQKAVAALLVQKAREGQVDDLLQLLFETLKEARVRLLLFDWAPLLAAVLLSRWGAEVGKDLVDAVMNFDRRLVEAASRVLR